MGALGRAIGLARRSGRALAALLLPRVCAVCGELAGEQGTGAVCDTCWSRVPALPAPRCDRCGHPQRLRSGCAWCETLPPFVRAARSCCWAVDGPSLAIVHALKYAGWRSVAKGMAARMARLDWPWDVVAERAALVPVPLAPARRRERGFNQSELIADGLARRWGVPVWPHALARVRATGTQTQLTPGERRINVRGAFRAPHHAPDLRGTHLVLVDDVVTTAATLNACAAALCEAGARIVSYVTFARAPALGDRR